MTQVVSFTAVDDVGTVVNPIIVEGQVHGGLAQGIGQALIEEARYDPSGQLLSGSFLSYAMPRAGDLPRFEVATKVTRCAHNPIGAKGVGEVGAIGSPPAVINAVVDALAHLGVRHVEMPATPERIWRTVRDHQAKEG